jgi:thimet oligopeptidase
MSGHYTDSSQKVPQSMVGSLLSSRTLGQGLSYAQWLAQSKMDIDFHTASGPVNVTAVSNAEITNLTGMAPVEGNHFPATFGHVMWGYDSGYYSYIWSEAFALDIFSQFQGQGIYNQTTGARYRGEILSQGDLKDADVLLRNFLGRDADSRAFMKKLNITQGQ